MTMQSKVVVRSWSSAAAAVSTATIRTPSALRSWQILSR